MIQIGEDLHLVSKTTPDGFAAEAWIDELDCNLLAVMFVVSLGKVDSAHTAVADLAQYFIWANATAGGCIESQTSSIGRACFHRVALRIDSMGQQLIDLSAQIRIVHAHGVEKLSLSLSLEF